MWNFSLRSPPALRSYRRGTLEQTGGLSMETPLPLIYTRWGYVPGITPDLLATLPFVQPIALQTIWDHWLAALPKEEQQTALVSSLQALPYGKVLQVAAWGDCGQTTRPLGKHGDRFYTVASPRGHQTVTVERWRQWLDRWVTAASGEWLLAPPADDPRDREASRKRAQKSVDRSVTFLDATLDEQEIRPSSTFLGVVTGSMHAEERERSARETALRSPLVGDEIE